MRILGTLSKWNDERGFGFIKPTEGGGDLFVHITAFPRDGAKPKLDESLSFEVETTPEGKRRAVRVWRTDASGRAVFTLEPMRPRSKRISVPHRTTAHTTKARYEPHYRQSRHGSGVRFVVTLAILVCLGVFGYFKAPGQLIKESTSKLAPSFTPAPTHNYQCDGRKYCSQMGSYEEAKWFLDHCPGMKMDGDGDGIPCESQF